MSQSESEWLIIFALGDETAESLSILLVEDDSNGIKPAHKSARCKGHIYFPKEHKNQHERQMPAGQHPLDKQVAQKSTCSRPFPVHKPHPSLLTTGWRMNDSNASSLTIKKMNTISDSLINFAVIFYKIEAFLTIGSFSNRL